MNHSPNTVYAEFDRYVRRRERDWMFFRVFILVIVSGVILAFL